MTQEVSEVRKKYVEKPVQRIKGSPGSYWVQSSKFKQLWYKVTLTETRVYCACKYFKNKHEMCKHLFKIMEIDGGGRAV